MSLESEIRNILITHHGGSAIVVNRSVIELVNLFENHPVNRVRAMALFIISAGGRWYTPDGYVVEQHGDELVCSCCGEDCEHIRAACVYQERTE